jgi:hypothetical protein
MRMLLSTRSQDIPETLMTPKQRIRTISIFDLCPISVELDLIEIPHRSSTSSVSTSLGCCHQLPV